MTKTRDLEKALKWFTSVLLAIFYAHNAFEKIFKPNEVAKFGLTNASVFFVGIIVLIATILFLINKTIIIGTVTLASYMTFVVFVHINKGKPFLFTTSIVLATIFTGYLRKAKLSALR